MKKRWIIGLVLLVAACGGETPTPAAGGGAGEPAKVTNRIDIPPTVVQNLGITFAKVERRHVSKTLRLPGFFESPPHAIRAYAAPLAGRVTLLVKQYDRVESGQELYRLESPELVRLLHDINDADTETAQRRAEASIAKSELDAAQRAISGWPARLSAAEAAIAASEEHTRKLEAALELWNARIAQLLEIEKAGGGKAAELAEARSRAADSESAIAEERETRAGFAATLAELKAGMEADRGKLPALNTAADKARAAADAADVHAQMVRHEVAVTLGVDRATLAGDGWRKLEGFTQTAQADGVVQAVEVSDGASLTATTAVLRTLDDKVVVFRARALQADLGLLEQGMAASVVPPAGGALGVSGALGGKIQLAPEADPDDRTFDLIVAISGKSDWARPGITAEVEVVYDSTEGARLAIPLACVMQDGLDKIFFRRDPADANKVIRIVASLGTSDGRWVVVNTGVVEGDEVVMAGAYELKLTGAGKASGKGHFHADGTYHEGDD